MKTKTNVELKFLTKGDIDITKAKCYKCNNKVYPIANISETSTLKRNYLGNHIYTYWDCENCGSVWAKIGKKVSLKPSDLFKEMKFEDENFISIKEHEKIVNKIQKGFLETSNQLANQMLKSDEKHKKELDELKVELKMRPKKTVGSELRDVLIMKKLAEENQEYKEANKHLKECWKERTAEWKEIEDKLKQQLTDLKKIAKERTQDMCKESELKFKSVYKLVEENKALKIIAMNLDNQISEYKNYKAKVEKVIDKVWKKWRKAYAKSNNIYWSWDELLKQKLGLKK